MTDIITTPAVRRWYLSENITITALLLIVSFLYLWPATLAGRVFTPSDMIFDFGFFQDASPSGYRGPSNGILSDAVLKFYPWHTVARQALQEGQFPFWNPYIYSGTPLFANAESSILYPLNILGYLLPLNQALTLSVLLRLFVAGWGTFLFLRTQKVSVFAALLAAITFMLSGSMVVWLNYPIGNAYAWLPLLFFFGERMLLVSRNGVNVAATSLIIAVQILGGHYQTSFITLFAWGIYCLYRLIIQYRETGNWRSVFQKAVVIAGSVIVGFALVAVQLIPFANWLGETNEAQFRSEERSFALIHPTFPLGLLTMPFALASPNLFGNPVWGADSFIPYNYIEQALYVGIVPLTLVTLALFRAKHGARQRQTFFWAGLGLFFLAIALRVPGIDFLNYAPLLNIVATERYRLVFTFCLAVLAGIGAEEFIQLARGDRVSRRMLWSLLAFAGGTTIMILAISWALHNLTDRLLSFERVAAVYPTLLEVFQLTNLEMVFPIAIALGFSLVLFLYGKNVLSVPLLKYSLVALILADLYIFGAGFNPTIPESEVFPTSEPVQFLQTQPHEQYISPRLVALHDTLPPNTGTPFGFSDITGSDFPQRRYLELAESMGATLLDGHNRLYFPSVPRRALLGMMNVQYVVEYTGYEDDSRDGLRQVFRNDAVGILENPEVLPRAFTVHNVRTIADATEMLETLNSASFDPSREIIIEESPPEGLLQDDSPPEDEVEIVQNHTQSVRIHVIMAENGFLFLGDAYYPGWRASVDGHESKIYRANYSFRAVYLPVGEHVVEFNYIAPGFDVGLAISAAALLVTLLIFVISWRVWFTSRLLASPA